MKKINFASDNYAGIHPDILQAITNANNDPSPAYGSDGHTSIAIEKFKEQFGSQAEVFFVFNGTAANVTALQSLMKSFEAVICANKAHIQVDECGAPEKLTGGKLLLVESANGKMNPDLITPLLERVGDQHYIQPRVISISQSTEFGTIYTANEIKKLSDFAHQNNLYLHMDGARISNAAASLNASFKSFTSDAGVDVVSFGGTKNGMMLGEAVIFINPALAKNFPYIRKQSMQLASKMRFISSQFNALLTNNLWFTNANHANQMAQLLANQLTQFPEIQLTQQVQANGIFAIFPRKLINKLLENFHFYVWNETMNEVRLMTSFNTLEREVTSLIDAIKSSNK